MRRKSPLSFSLSNQFSHGAGSANIRYSILPPPPRLATRSGCNTSYNDPCAFHCYCTARPPPPSLGAGLLWRVGGCCTCRQLRHRGINHNIFAHEKHLGGIPSIKYFEWGGRYLPLLLRRVYFSANLCDGCHCPLLITKIFCRTGTFEPTAWQRRVSSAVRAPVSFSRALLL